MTGFRELECDTSMVLSEGANAFAAAALDEPLLGNRSPSRFKGACKQPFLCARQAEPIATNVGIRSSSEIGGAMSARRRRRTVRMWAYKRSPQTSAGKKASAPARRSGTSAADSGQSTTTPMGASDLARTRLSEVIALLSSSATRTTASTLPLCATATPFSDVETSTLRPRHRSAPISGALAARPATRMVPRPW